MEKLTEKVYVSRKICYSFLKNNKKELIMFKVVPKSPSINIDEWISNHPRYCAIIERDKEHPERGWIRYRGSRPFPYSLNRLCEETNYCEQLHCDPHDCYEIIPHSYKIPEKGVILSPDRQKEVLRAMNRTKGKSIES